MSVNSKVMTALSGIGVPVSFQTYSGTADPYITFFCYLETGEVYVDDVEQGVSYYVQVDVWSSKNYSNVVEQVKLAMKQAGFSFLSAYDSYEPDEGIYHKVLRFYYYEEVESNGS